MNKIIFVSILWLSVTGFSASASAPTATDADFQVVVNPANPMSTVNQRFLAEIFLKKKVFWPDGREIIVVDLTPMSRTRLQFSEGVLGRSVSAVRNYWRQQLFSGGPVPPPEFTEQEVLDFVAKHEDAIGYVSGHADLHDLKPLLVK